MKITHQKDYSGHQIYVTTETTWQKSSYSFSVTGRGETKADAIANAVKAMDDLAARWVSIRTELQNL